MTRTTLDFILERGQKKPKNLSKINDYSGKFRQALDFIKKWTWMNGFRKQFMNNNINSNELEKVHLQKCQTQIGTINSAMKINKFCFNINRILIKSKTFLKLWKFLKNSGNTLNEKLIWNAFAFFGWPQIASVSANASGHMYFNTLAYAVANHFANFAYVSSDFCISLELQVFKILFFDFTIFCFLFSAQLLSDVLELFRSTSS